MMKLLIVSALAGLASAACPNSCSGHGTCGTNEVCTCFDGWGMGGAAGGDCSDRFCPYELAWVDAPDKDGKTHQYAECAARGICDREIGECECFGGFEGKGCGRQVCPDSCSGHGTCEYMNELNFGTVYNDYYDGASTPALYSYTTQGITDFISDSFALRFTSSTNETFTTIPVELVSADTAGLNDLADDIDAALENLPNRVITGVTVTAAEIKLDSGKGMAIKVTFDGDSVHGQQNLLEVSTNICGDGCTPKIDGFDTLVSNTNTTSSVIESVAANYNSFECGRRGKCDYDTGLCSCFEGYTGEACTALTALV